MSHSYSQDYQHIVFSTKDRLKLITQSMQPKLWSYMAGIGRNHGFLVLANGGISDHVHLLVQVPARLSAAKVVSLLKTNSSRWICTTVSRLSATGACTEAKSRPYKKVAL